MKARLWKRAPRAWTIKPWALRMPALALLLPAAEASACSACAGPPMSAKTLHAYVGLTVGLSLLPMALSVIVFLALRRQASSAAGDNDGSDAA